jgi:aryl-alcohol dehydrogenase-like predicted oxidoreductase
MAFELVTLAPGFVVSRIAKGNWQLAERHGAPYARRLRVSTKLVPDLASLPRLRRRDVQRIVDTSLARLGQERLDLVQFHWCGA